MELSNPAHMPSAPPARRQRLRQFLWVAAGASVAVALVNLLTARYMQAALALGMALALALAQLLAHQGHMRLALGLLVAGLLVGDGLTLMLDLGLRDPGGVLGLAGPLVFATMMGGRRAFAVTTVLVLALVAVVASGDVLGWMPHAVRPATWATWLSASVVLLALAVCMGLMAGDLRDATRAALAQARAARASQARLQQLAYEDLLTGLPNRAAMQAFFDKAAADARRRGVRLVLMHLGLDNFKAINDSLGHAAGDRLLVRAAELLADTVRGGDVVGRVAGDEFLLLMADGQGEGLDVSVMADKLVRRLAEPMEAQGQGLYLTASLGVAVYPDDAQDFGALAKCAEAALRNAKEAGRNTFRAYNPAMNVDAAAHLQLLTSMRAALDYGQFELHYQPQVDLRSQRLVGCEALLRWRRPGSGLVAPGDFISAAEKSGLIVQIGAWVLREACRQLREWDAQGLPPTTVAVNLSPVQFRRDDLLAVVGETLRLAGVAPQRVELELTESLLLHDSERLSALMAALGGMGLMLAIDDFGTGYSNLGYLRRFAVDRLKVDRSFVHHITTDTHNEAIVRAVIQIARSLDMQVVAEGVEDQATVDHLLALGCDVGQGWHWSPALPADAYAAFARAWRAAGADDARAEALRPGPPAAAPAGA